MAVTMKGRRPSSAAIAIDLGVALFVGLEAAAMALYPGGTWFDATAHGHRFWQNYLCDLEWRVALNGAPNPVGSWLAQAAMLVLVATLAPFWLALPRLFPASARTGAAVRRLGLLSVAGAAAVVLLPSDRFPLHGAVVIVAGVPGLAAVLLAVLGLVRGEPRPKVAAALGVATLAGAAVDFAFHTIHVIRQVEAPPLVPALQKVTLGLLLAWMLTAAAKAPRDHHETSNPRPTP